MVVQFAKARGYKVIGIDVGPEKKSMATDAGADAYIDALAVKAEDVPAEVQKLTNGLGAHAVRPYVVSLT